MAFALKSTPGLLHLKKHNTHSLSGVPSGKAFVSIKRFTPMATLTTAPTLGLSDTFSKLKNEGKVSIFPLLTLWVFL